MTLTIADILAPMDWATFARDYKGQKPLHLKGPEDKFATVMSWPLLSGLLSQTSIWTPKLLTLRMDKQRVAVPDFCSPGLDREGREAMLPDLDKIAGWLRRGASLILNDIADLAPGLKQAARTLEAAGLGKAQANLYCSWKAHPAFDTHFDTHDVYAFQITGHKTWQIYRQPHRDPIAHPAFKPSHEQIKAERGPVTMTVRLAPGDLLYIPRGWYHDALAESEATIHVAFGLTALIGLRLIDGLFDRAVRDPLFRADLPTDDALAAHLATLGDRLAAMARDPAFLAETRAKLDGFRYPRADLRLPEQALETRYRRRSAKIQVVVQGGRHVLRDGSQGAPIPPGLEDAVRWVLGQDGFAEADLAAAFPLMNEPARQQLVERLRAMRVIEPA